MKRILVTGGAGYIGSHTCVELMNAGHEVFIYDNFSNSSPIAIERVEKITGKAIRFIQGDILDQYLLENTIKASNCDTVIHFAGLKSVGESVKQPINYYENNVVGTLTLLKAMTNCNINKLVFSSSATVYGNPKFLPLTEDHPLSATNPYGNSKLIIEDILRDIHISSPDWSITILRYFNPVGAHSSGLIGEDPRGIPNNLMPYVAQVAIGRLAELTVFGNDYDTADGTGVRDYIHVSDLAKGHLKAIEQIGMPQCSEINLGTGVGYSVIDVINAFKRASNRDIPFRFAERRNGDIATCFADPKLAKEILGWEAELGIKEMCNDHWAWQHKNPEGYGVV
ncbi:UDP-glucose 4-epimerase GalE [Pseudomonas umsongensis]|uniref:UDP-glucose 4-epimerase n=1 Tax=Pseudomonas umsongensis TaxID=198618 RepID=A0ABX4DXQ9_9PSED|nr:UDP-glucose 4-epimerase GalE [Pseudomonas umsongensis]OXR33486.1 UDP-glucose 4-epimerase GalE [Pseudomonas umsongensis]SDS61337.1 UDP-galactose 4-epimerase [Pseudomonas umsongensis]